MSWKEEGNVAFAWKWCMIICEWHKIINKIIGRYMAVQQKQPEQ